MVGARSSPPLTLPPLEEEVEMRVLEPILDTVAEIQERHDAVQDLERKLLELQKMRRTMAL